MWSSRRGCGWVVVGVAQNEGVWFGSSGCDFRSVASLVINITKVNNLQVYTCITLTVDLKTLL